MENLQKIARIEAIGLSLAVLSNNVIFNTTSIIFNSCGSGSWLSVIFLSIISLIFMFIVLALYKVFPTYDLLDISKYLGGKSLKYIVAILYVIFFTAFSIICLRYFASDLHVIYFPGYSYLFLILLVFVPVVISTRTGLKAIYGTNLVVIPITVLSTFLLFFILIRDFSWQRLFPIFGYGAKNLFITQSINLFTFNIIGYLYFLPPFLKDTKDYKKISIFTIIICGLYYLLTILALTMTFAYGFKADESFSLYLIARLATLGRFFQRIDAVFFLVWILAFLSFLSFNIYLVTYIIKKSFELSSSNELVYSISVIIIGGSLVFANIANVNSFTQSIFRPFTFILIFCMSFVILLIANFKKRRSTK